MAARSLLKPLLDRAQEKGSKVICVGDAGQIAAIDRGDISRILLADANVLQEVHRQKDPIDIRASQNIAQGYIKEAVEHYSNNTQILETDFSAKLRLSCDYAEKVENSKSAMDHMIIAYKNSDVLDLNYKIQNNLKESGYLGKEFTILAGFNVADNEHKKSIDLEGYSYDKAKRFYDHLDKKGIYYEKFKQIMQPETFHIGDKVRFASNWNKGISGKEVYNGTLGIIKSYDEKNNIIEIIRDNGDITSVEAGKYQALTLGYAVTINRSQGKTVDNSYLYLSNSKGATIGAKEFYVATTRHKEELYIYSSKEYLGTKSVNQKIAERHKLTAEDFVVNKDLLNEIQGLDQIKTKTYGLWNEMQQDVRSGKCDLWQHDKFSLYKEMKDTRSKLAFSVEQQWEQARLFAREINLERSDLLRWQGKEERIISDEDKLLSSYREARGKAKELWQENLTEGSPANSPKYVEYKDQADQRNELAYEIATFGSTKEIYNRDGEITEANRFNFTHASEWREIVRNSNSFIQDNLQKAREEKSLSLEANEAREEFVKNSAEELVIDNALAQNKEQDQNDAASDYAKTDQSDQQEIDQQNPYSLEKSSGLDEHLVRAEGEQLALDAVEQSVGQQLDIGSAESDIKEENNLHFTEENKDELDMTQQFDSGFEEDLVIDKTDAQIRQQGHIDAAKDYAKIDQSDQLEIDQQNPYSLEKSSGLDEQLASAEEGEQLDADVRGQSVGQQLEIGSAESDIKEENNLHFTEENKDELDMIVKFDSGYDCKELENSLKDKSLDDQKSALKELKTELFADYLQNKVDDFMDKKIEAKSREDLLEVLEKEHGFLQETMRDHINEMYDLGREYRELKHIIVENSKNKDLVNSFDKKLQVLDSTNNASMLQSTLDSVRTNSLAQVDNNLTKFVESIGNKTLKTIEQEKNIDLSDYYKNAPAIEKQQESVKSYQPVREKSTEYGKEESGRPDYMYESYKVFSGENHASHKNKDEEKELDIEVRTVMGEQIGRNNSEQFNTYLHFEKVEVFDRDGKLNKYHNKDMLGVLDACKHLDQLSKMPIAQQAQEQGIRDYEGELHKDVNSYLLSVGLNEKLAANIDPNSSIGQRMHELLQREHQYHIEKNVAVDQRSTYCITREIQENYTHLKEHHINARIDSDLQRTDFQGVSHHDPKQYLRSVILDSRVQSKIDFDDKSLGSTLEKEFGRAIEPDRSREMDRGMELSL